MAKKPKQRDPTGTKKGTSKPYGKGKVKIKRRDIETLFDRSSGSLFGRSYTIKPADSPSRELARDWLWGIVKELEEIAHQRAAEETRPD